MKTLYESILSDNVISESLLSDIGESLLSDMKDTIASGNDNVEKLVTFGKRYKFTRAIVGSASGSLFNSKALKQLTKNLDYSNRAIETGYFEKSGKVKMFANWLDHLKFEDINIKPGNDNDNDYRKELGDKILDHAKELGLFNTTNLHLWCSSTRVTTDNSIDVVCGRTDRNSNSYVFKLCYEINK